MLSNERVAYCKHILPPFYALIAVGVAGCYDMYGMHVRMHRALILIM
jgi:hypothetical protein